MNKNETELPLQDTVEVSETSELENLDLNELSIGFNDDGEIILVKHQELGAEPKETDEKSEADAEDTSMVSDEDNVIPDVIDQRLKEAAKMITERSQEVTELKKQIEDLKYLMMLSATRGQQTPSPEDEEDLLSILGDKQRGKPYIQNEINTALKPVLKSMKDVVENMQIEKEFNSVKEQYGEEFTKLLPDITKVFDEKPHFTFEDAFHYLRSKAQGKVAPAKTSSAPVTKTVAEVQKKVDKYAPVVKGEAPTNVKGDEVDSVKAAYILAMKQVADGRY